MRNRVLAILALPLVLGLMQCQPKPKPPSPYAYDVIFEFTPAASAKMQATAMGEINVTAFYYGMAKPEYASEADSAYRIRLGYESLVWPWTVRRARMPVEELDTSLFPKIVDSQPMVLLKATFIPSKGNHPNGFLNCRSVVIDIKTAQTTPPVMKCDVPGGV